MSDQKPKNEQLVAAAFEPRAAVISNAKPRFDPLTLAAIGGGLIVAYVFFFLLTARSLTLTAATETPLNIELSGVYVPFGDRLLLRPGSYDLRVTAEGYQPLEERLSVDNSEVQTRVINLTPLPGNLVLEANPDGAEVRVDGTLRGVTPLTLEGIAAGSISLKLSADRYLDFESTLEIEGRGITQRVKADLTPGWARVIIDTLPQQVQFLIDNKPANRIGGVLEALSGDRQLTIVAPGYVSEIIDFEAIADTDIDLGKISLAAARGILKLTSLPSGASVTRDGQFVGTTPVDVPMEPNTSHQIVLRRAGYESSEIRLTLGKGDKRTRQISMTPALGDVAIEITPKNARIFVNGTDNGAGNQILALPSVEQTITISALGYASVERLITPRAGLAQRLRIDLMTEEEARKAAIKPEIRSSVGQSLVLVDPLAVPVNTFTMGAPRRDAGRGANEVEHEVTLTRAFYLGKTEVTNAQFRQFTSDHDSGQEGGKSLNRENQPAVQLSWQQAASFCNWLSAREGLDPFYRERDGIVIGFNPASTGYRLPSEAEWAFASRIHGNDVWRFAWGEAWPPEDNSANLADGPSAIVTGRILNGYSDGVAVSAEVAKFPPNPRGLYDMGGNVAEWVNDVYRISVPGDAARENPLGDKQGDNFTIRGASWSLSRLRELRLTYRDYGERGRDDLGFRVARYAE